MDLAYQLLWKTQATSEANDMSCHELIHTLNHGNFALIGGGPRIQQLRRDLDGAGYRVTPAMGSYGGSQEAVFMVHDPNEKDILALGERYKQQSVIIANKGRTILVVTTGPSKGHIRAGRGWSVAAAQDVNFTQVETSDGETVRFRLEF